LKDVEPDRDLAILFHPRTLALASKALPALSSADLRQRIERGHLDRKALRGAARELDKTVDDVVRFAAEYHAVARKKLGLPEPLEAEVRAEVARSVKLMGEAAAARPRKNPR
jgi:hypothetical protein